jgi:hypothetical protein
MLSISSHLRELERAIVSAGKYTLHETRVYFSAPNPKHPSVQTLTTESSKQMEANFQWTAYSVLFTDKDMNWFIFRMRLDPWGTAQAGTEEINGSDPTGDVIDTRTPVEITTDEVKKSFPVLKGPKLFPQVRVFYINGHESDKLKKYSSQQFRQSFCNGFYVVVTKTKMLETPCGETVGKKPEK